MDEARRLLARLDRIDALGRNQVPAETLLVELRALVAEAEAWAEREGDESGEAGAAAAAVRSAVAWSARAAPASPRPPPMS
jgi:hypothetical protein